MTMRETKDGLDMASMGAMAEAIKGAMPTLDATDREIATAVYRFISRGGPVEPADVAAAVGVSLERVNERLEAWPGVYRDDKGGVVGFWGHAIEKLDPEYRLVADDATTYAWCALDTLFIPGIIGKTVRVEASDPISGEPVSLVVDRGGAREVQPPGAVVSMVVPNGPFGYDVIESFCHRVLFFASEETGNRWIAKHQGTTLLPLDQAFEIGRALSERVLPSVLRSKS